MLFKAHAGGYASLYVRRVTVCCNIGICVLFRNVRSKMLRKYFSLDVLPRMNDLMRPGIFILGRSLRVRTVCDGRGCSGNAPVDIKEMMILDLKA